MVCGVSSYDGSSFFRFQNSTYPPEAVNFQEFEAKSNASPRIPGVLAGRIFPLKTPLFPFQLMSFTTLPVHSKSQYPTRFHQAIPARKEAHVHSIWLSRSNSIVKDSDAVTRSTDVPSSLTGTPFFNKIHRESPRT